MCARLLRRVSILSLVLAALGAEDSGDVRWRNSGDSITVSCNTPLAKNDVWELYLKKGLHAAMQDQVLFLGPTSDQPGIKEEFINRTQTNGVITKLDITIRNLTVNDTGVYWCEYKVSQEDDLIIQPGDGSVLLVVKGEAECEAQSPRMTLFVVLVSTLTCGTMLLLLLITCFLWILPKVKAMRKKAVKPQRSATADVYEDMRGTLRR